jgi:hypothetical protein
MRAIQENEMNQLRDLSELLANEIQYVSQYLEVLKDTQNDWLDEYVPFFIVVVFIFHRI